MLALIAIAALALGPWSPGAARAFNPQPDPPGFGMIGLARGQTARVSVVALGGPAGSAGEVCGIEPLPFHVAFRDSEGRVLAEARELMLQPGQSAFLDLDGSHLLRRRGQRLPIRASVESTRGAAFCGIATVELFSNLTGRTSVVYAGLP
jgi:hypothetical protein